MLISDAQSLESIKTMKLAKWVTSLPNLNILMVFFSLLPLLYLFDYGHIKKKKKSNIRKTIMNENIQPTNNNFNNVK